MYTLQLQKKSVPWAAIFAVATGVALVAFVLTHLLFQVAQGEQVTLKALSSGGMVQVYDDISVDSSLVKEFADGTRCAKLNGPTHAKIDGVAMNLYQVNCKGTYGHVNARWVKD